jgi:hypothetical protein
MKVAIPYSSGLVFGAAVAQQGQEAIIQVAIPYSSGLVFGEHRKYPPFFSQKLDFSHVFS